MPTTSHFPELTKPAKRGQKDARGRTPSSALCRLAGALLAALLTTCAILACFRPAKKPTAAAKPPQENTVSAHTPGRWLAKRRARRG